MSSNKLLPDIDLFFSDWYNEVVFRAELMDHAPVRGCMIIRPYGYAIWERMQEILNKEITSMGAQNTAFPMLIPYSFIAAEKEHIEGFSPEIVLVTHAGGKKLEEPYIVRPTSETIIHDAFSRWIKSWRDLPVKINQWCSVIRWEKKARPFIRTGEFLWQEGHTAHETEKEAYKQAYEAREVYRTFITRVLNIPVICGKKPSVERFAGALTTLTLESMMHDGKALQMGTSHVLDQKFAEAFSIKFQNKHDGWDFVHLTSWGVTTRLIGAVIMSHGDAKGLILPWHVAPYQCVVVPIIKKGCEEQVMLCAQNLFDTLKKLNIRSFLDASNHETPGFKFNKWELRGVPFRIELGMRDIEEKKITLAIRDTGEKISLNIDFSDKQILCDVLRDVFEHQSKLYQGRMFARAQKRLTERTKDCTLLSEISFDEIDEEDNQNEEESTPGKQNTPTSQKNFFWKTNWCCLEDTYPVVKAKHLTVRCILEDEVAQGDICCVHGVACPKKEELKRVIVAKSY